MSKISVAEKPHMGKMVDAMKRPINSAYGLGYMVIGRFEGHPDFDGYVGHTSYVVAETAVNEDGSVEIETRNSRYTVYYAPDV